MTKSTLWSLENMGISHIPLFDRVYPATFKRNSEETSIEQLLRQLKSAAYRLHENISRRHSIWAAKDYRETLEKVAAELHDLKMTTQKRREETTAANC